MFSSSLLLHLTAWTALSSAQAAPTLDFTGVCPGPVRIDITGATPFEDVLIASADDRGFKQVNVGPCAGIIVDLSPSGLTQRIRRPADADGNFTRTPVIPDAACHSWVQVVDLASCTLSPVKPLPWDADHDGHASLATGGEDCDDTDPDVFPGNLDLPDDAFVDANCDGIDGSIDDALFVSKTGVDGTGCSIDAPCATIDHAMLVGQTLGINEIYLQTGTYYGVVELRSGIDLHGGYDANWDRGPHTSPQHEVVLAGAVSVDGQPMVIRARSGDVATITNLVLRAPDATATGQSSYGVHAIDAMVLMSSVTVIQGDGAVGAAGASGADADANQAASGGSGCNGDSFLSSCDTARSCGGGAASNASCSTANGGAGGQGGQMDQSCDWLGLCDNCNASPGLPGADAPTNDPTHGQGGNGGNTCSGGASGLDGLVRNGVGGTAVSGLGYLGGDFWFGDSGNAGTLGEHGGGGGGGGGSGGCDAGTDDRGAGGGGGGAGGCRANPGGGGLAGGGSFGVFARNSQLSVQATTLLGGNGGAGGNGGQGGAGQPGGFGGVGGTGTADSPQAGSGGDGGHGGHGGGGGGGNGGVVAGIFVQGSTLQQSGNTFSVGVGGAGGLGGFSAPNWGDGNNGQPGNAGQVGYLFICVDPANC